MLLGAVIQKMIDGDEGDQLFRGLGTKCVMGFVKDVSRGYPRRGKCRGGLMAEPSEFRTLGEAIRARRLELGWSQEQLAARINDAGDDCHQSDVSRLERGKVGLPRRARLERIAVALDLPLGELLARSGWANAEVAFKETFSPAPVQSERPSAAANATSLSARAPVGHQAAGTPRDRTTDLTAVSVTRLRAAVDQARATQARSVDVLQCAAQAMERAALPHGRAAMLASEDANERRRTGQPDREPCDEGVVRAAGDGASPRDG